MKSQKAITLSSLIITIIVMILIAGTTVGISLDRFKTNNLKKMYNDIELLNNKVSIYYIKTGGLPILKQGGNRVLYTFSALNFNKDVNDNANYFIIDLSSIDNITLNYGKEGYENPNESEDVYIINEKSHTIYYVKGVESASGNTYHSLKLNNIQNSTTIGPTKAEINILSGTLIGTDKMGIEKYTSDAEIQIIPGKDSVNGILSTTYTIRTTDLTTEESTVQTAEILESTVINNLQLNKKYEITVTVTSNNNLQSENSYTIKIPKMINFNIEDTSYQAEEGMTWQQFCNSEYNDNTFSIDSNNNEVVMVTNDVTNNILKNSITEKATDIIENNTTYNKGTVN